MEALADPTSGSASLYEPSENPMHFSPAWTLDATKLLTRRELATVLADAKKKAQRSANARCNLVILRLACCGESLLSRNRSGDIMKIDN
jgi:hypothetical protein